MYELFRKFARGAAAALGTPWAFLSATIVIIVWAIAGPFFHFSNGWQLVVNTMSSIVTLGMVFIIQNTQNRDSRAIQLKLDELIRASSQTPNTMINLESLTDEQLRDIQGAFRELRQQENISIQEFLAMLRKRTAGQDRQNHGRDTDG
jgi:low affinity Fe/Cu permease